MDEESSHILKTDPEPFDAVAAMLKRFEIRYDDRGFKVGDWITLQKTQHTGAEMKKGEPLLFTGDQITCKVTYIMRGPVYGLGAGWVIMGIDRY